jgi:outer membrane autotransporter protein
MSSFAPERDAGLPDDVARAYASALKAPAMTLKVAPPATLRWTTWAASFGGYNQTNGDPGLGSSNVIARDYGFAGGADYHFTPDTAVGFALAGGGTNWGLAQARGSGRSDAFSAGLYATTHAGPAYLAGALAFADHWFSTNRTALGDQLNASFNGQSFGARVEAGYRYGLPFNTAAVGITPYAALQTQVFHTPAYNESDLLGAGLGLAYAANNATDTRSELGARFDTLTALNGMPLLWRGRVAWAHDWVGNPSLSAAFQALPGASFVVNGAPAPTDSALTSVSADLKITAAWSLQAKFDGELARNAQTYAGTGTVRYKW